MKHDSVVVSYKQRLLWQNRRLGVRLMGLVLPLNVRSILFSAFFMQLMNSLYRVTERGLVPERSQANQTCTR